MCYNFAALKDEELCEDDKKELSEADEEEQSQVEQEDHQIMLGSTVSLGEDIPVSTDMVWTNAFMDHLILRDVLIQKKYFYFSSVLSFWVFECVRATFRWIKTFRNIRWQRK